jgi:hypothetical protein
MATNSFATNFAQRLMGLGLVPQAVEPVREQANKYLDPYGLSMPTADQINPNVFFPNTGFFGNHPRVTNALEGALMGAAFTAPSNNAGEAIGNIARGLLQSRDYQQQNIVKQYMAPFAMAGQMATLQQAQDQHAVAQGSAEYYKKHGQYLEDSIDARKEAAFERLMYQFKPTGAGWEPNPGAAIVALNKYRRDPNSITEDDFKNLWTFNKDAASRTGRGGSSMVERLASAEEAEEVQRTGRPWTAKQYTSRVNQIIAGQAGGRSAASTEASTTIHEEHGDIPEDLRVDIDQVNRDYNGRLPDPTNQNEVESEAAGIFFGEGFKGSYDDAQKQAQANLTGKRNALAAERDAKVNELKTNYRQKRGRSAAVPRPTAKAPLTPTPVKPGRVPLTLNPDGTIKIG